MSATPAPLSAPSAAAPSRVSRFNFDNAQRVYAEALLNDARKWALEETLVGTAGGEFVGVVYFLAAEPFRWSRGPADAFTVIPGVLAVHASGHVYRAEGGNEVNGAERWELLFNPEGVK